MWTLYFHKIYAQYILLLPVNFIFKNPQKPPQKTTKQNDLVFPLIIILEKSLLYAI